MNNLFGYIIATSVCLFGAVFFWVKLDEMILYADTTWAWVMLVLGGLAVHGALVGIQFYYMKGFGIIDPKSWKARRKLRRKKRKENN